MMVVKQAQVYYIACFLTLAAWAQDLMDTDGKCFLAYKKNFCDGIWKSPSIAMVRQLTVYLILQLFTTWQVNF